MLVNMVVFRVEAQVLKAFLDDEGNITDSLHATSYLIYAKTSDSLYAVRYYSLNDRLITVGSYKDKDFTIQHGEFLYFNRSLGKADTATYIKTRGNFRNGVKDGIWIDYYPNGHPQFVNTFRNGKLDGISEDYNYATNTVFLRGQYINGLEEGEWDNLSPDGDTVIKYIYRHGKEIKRESVNISAGAKNIRLVNSQGRAVPDTVQGFIAIDVLPEPRGGIEMFYKNLIFRNLKYPAAALSSRVEGTVVVGFVVEKDGSLTDINIERGVSHDIDAEAIRLVKLSRKWMPGKVQGKPCRVKYSLSIVFQIN